MSTYEFCLVRCSPTRALYIMDQFANREELKVYLNDIYIVKYPDGSVSLDLETWHGNSLDDDNGEIDYGENEIDSPYIKIVQDNDSYWWASAYKNTPENWKDEIYIEDTIGKFCFLKSVKHKQNDYETVYFDEEEGELKCLSPHLNKDITYDELHTLMQLEKEEAKNISFADYKNVENSLSEISGVDIYFGIGKQTIDIDVVRGDWKHEHGYMKEKMKELGYILINSEITEDDGSDTYSAYYVFKKDISKLFPRWENENKAPLKDNGER